VTTATAWRNALTGVGATIAAGSQPWRGIHAAFTNPTMKRRKRTCRMSAEPDPARNPPGTNTVVPVRI
jgi:hypothetical protein